MRITETPLYRKAFERYLRTGASIELSLKAIETTEHHSTPFYIWRTAGDDKVRPEHAANNGRIFEWNKPPSTGNPGEAINCRCTAEPYNPKVSEYAYQELISNPNDAAEKWTNLDLVRHFYAGHGQPVTLSEIGHQAGVTEFYFYKITKEGQNIYDRVNEQIIIKAREVGAGTFTYPFTSSYDFGKYLFGFGSGAVSGLFSGSVKREGVALSIHGAVDYHYSDTFTDPVSIRQLILDSSEPLNANVGALLLSDGGGIFFDISGTWKTNFIAKANIDPSNSIYK